MWASNRLVGAVAIGIAAVAGERDQPQRLGPGRRGPEPARQLVAIHRGQADIEQRDVGIERAGDLERGRAIVRGPGLVAEPSSASDSSSAASMLSSTTSTRLSPEIASSPRGGSCCRWAAWPVRPVRAEIGGGMATNGTASREARGDVTRKPAGRVQPGARSEPYPGPSHHRSVCPTTCLE